MKEETDPRVAAYFRCLASAIEKEEKQRFPSNCKKHVWHVAQYGEPVKWLSVKHGSQTIARIEVAGIPLAEAKANAHMIAAAPALLEACQRALPAFEAMPPRVNEDRYEPLMMLRNAIAQAKAS